jgi:hypothetical protein
MLEPLIREFPEDLEMREFARACSRRAAGRSASAARPTAAGDC